MMTGPLQLRMTGRGQMRLMSARCQCRRSAVLLTHRIYQPSRFSVATITFHKGEEFELIETLFKSQL